MTFGVALLTVMFSARSLVFPGERLVIVALAVLLAAIGSPRLAAVMSAVLVIGVPAVPVFARTVNCKVALAPFASVPTFQRPTAAVNVPWLAEYSTKVRPAGRLSVT